MHLIYYKQRVLSHLWQYTHLLYQRADVINRVVRRRIQLVYVERATLVECSARLTLVTRLCSVRVLAVYRFGKYSRTSGLSHSARSTKEICVSQLPTFYGILQCRSNALLSHYRQECRRTVFSCRNDKFTHNTANIQKVYVLRPARAKKSLINFSTLRAAAKKLFYSGS